MSKDYNMRNLFEGLDAKDLENLIHNELHIDEFKSKLGDDSDVIVISFKVKDKEPAQDLVSFIEKGYNWVIDADVSSGEMSDGDFIVFVELDRNKEAPANIIELVEDMLNLTGQKLSDWRVRYYKNGRDETLDLETLERIIPLSSEAYERKYGSNDEELDQLKSAAGIDVDTKAPKNDYTESLRNMAGIIR